MAAPQDGRILSIRPHRPSIERHGASVPGCISPCNARYSEYRESVALGRRQPGIDAAPERRISACRLVSQSAGVPSDHAAQGRQQSGGSITPGTKVAPAPRV